MKPQGSCNDLITSDVDIQTLVTLKNDANILSAFVKAENVLPQC